MGLIRKTPAEKAAAGARRIAQRNANSATTRDRSERASAAWHRIDAAQRAAGTPWWRR